VGTLHSGGQKVLNFTRLAVAALLVVLAVLPAEARRNSDWVLLGEQSVGFRVDRDVITVPNGERQRFSQLRIEAERNDVFLISLALVYQNGFREEFRVGKPLSPGRDALPVALGGPRSFLRQIELVYRARPGFEGRAVVRVYGELEQRWRDRHEAGADRGFSVIGTETLSRDRRRAEFDVGRREGAFGAIRFRAEDDIKIDEAVIIFGNGERQRVSVGDRLDGGQMTDIIDLEGERRFINKVVIEARPRRGEGRARVTLLGRQRAGHADGGHDRPREEWVTIGRGGVAVFKADTDTYRVGRDAGLFRAIRVAVFGSNVRFYNMTIRYGNGQTENVPLSGTIRSGQVSQAFDLKGRDRYIDSVTFRYRSSLSLKGPSRIEVQGLKHDVHRGR